MELNSEICDTVLDVVRGAVPCVVVDMPHVWTSWSRQVLQQADDIVITATPELSSLRNAKNMFDLLKAARPNDAPARLVINQVGMGKRPEIPLKDFAEAIGVEPVLVLPFDPLLFGTAANNGQMLGEIKGDHKPAQGVSHLAAILTGRHAVPQRKKRSARSLLSFLGAKKAK
jgi:pilus assembly protein CpaE